MTYSELKKKDVICVGDGKVLGRVGDLELEAQTGRIHALIIACPGGLSALFGGEKNPMTIPFSQIACIGDDVILVAPARC